MATELEIMIHAKTYLDKLANGINPLTDENLPEEDVVNQVRISRCLFFVSDIMRRVIENGGVIKQQKSFSLKPFHLTEEQIHSYEIPDKPIFVSLMTERLNALVTEPGMKKLSHNSITGFLLNHDYLTVYVNSKGQNIRRPTERGLELGVFTEVRHASNGDYTVVLYDKNAQQFILDHMEEIEEINKLPKKELRSANPGRAERLDAEAGEMIREGEP